MHICTLKASCLLSTVWICKLLSNVVSIFLARPIPQRCGSAGNLSSWTPSTHHDTAPDGHSSYASEEELGGYRPSGERQPVHHQTRRPKPLATLTRTEMQQ